MAIKWENPPEDRENWAEVAKQLRDNPGVWALVKEKTYAGAAQNIKKGIYSGFTQGEFEARSASVKGSSSSNIYARYIGPA